MPGFVDYTRRVFGCQPSGDLSLRSVRDSAVAEPTLFLLWFIAAGASEMCLPVGVLREKVVLSL
jgi:hypothetical protein